MTQAPPPPYYSPPPPPAPIPPKKTHKVRWAVLGTIAVLALIGSISNAGKSNSPASSSQSSSSQSTSSKSSSIQSPEASTSSEVPVPAAPKVTTKHYSGRGADVVDVGQVDSAAIVTFTCKGCTDNTVLKTDGAESLLVNAIGAYSGSHLINVADSSMTTRMTVTANAPWTMTVEDVTAAPVYDSSASGRGDRAVLLNGPGSKAKITNRGEGNFVVEVYSADTGMDLAVNEIGSYSGTVPMNLPAFVQITSEGSWSIDAS